MKNGMEYYVKNPIDFGLLTNECQSPDGEV
jgi:hypothetical protein